MKSAWVITQEGTQHPVEVIGIISARKSARVIKEYVEWLYALLNYYPREHLDFARYHKPSVPYEAELWRTNTGVPVASLLTCGHNPFLVARLAKNVTLANTDGELPILEWTNPDRIECDDDTPRLITKIPGSRHRAPIHLPMRFAQFGPKPLDVASPGTNGGRD